MTVKKDVKLADSKFVKVVVSNRNPQDEATSCFCGSNMVIIDGNPNIKHYRLQLDKEVELPEICVDQLKARSQVGKDKQGNRISIPMYLVEKV